MLLDDQFGRVSGRRRLFGGHAASMAIALKD